jgi:hypothetical protein
MSNLLRRELCKKWVRLEISSFRTIAAKLDYPFLSLYER